MTICSNRKVSKDLLSNNFTKKVSLAHHTDGTLIITFLLASND